MQNFLKPLSAMTTKTGYTVVAGILVIMFSTWVFLDATKSEVVFADDGDVQTIKTDSATVGELLEDLGVDVNQYDELSHGENEAIVDGMEIRFEKANKVQLTIDAETEEYHTTAITVGQFFEEEGFDFSRYDDISHSNIEILNDDTEITVDKAFPVILDDGGEEEEIHATKGTVEDVLKDQEVEYDDSDRIEPGLDEEVEEDMEISVTYIDTEEDEVEEKIPYETIEEEDSSLPKGESKVKTEGKEGKVVKTYKVTYENGEEVSREVVDKDVKEKSKDKKVAIGTKEPEPEKTSDSTPSKSESSESSSKSSSNTETSSNSDSNSSSSSESESSPSGETMTMEATAYGPDCAGCSGTSATGMNLNGGGKVIAVDPSVIPLGSKVWVEGYGEAIAGDTGGDIQGNRIDVLMESESKASSSWGRRTVQVKILD